MLITRAGEGVTPRLCDTERRFMQQPEGVRRQLHPCCVLDSQKVKFNPEEEPQL